MEEIDGKPHHVIKIIPESKKSDIVLSTLWINTGNSLISKMENTTRNNGSYTVSMDYNDPVIELPTEIEISFRVENLKIPLKLIYYEVNQGIEDSFFDEGNNPD